MKFFHTLREKTFILRELKRGNLIPFLKYIVYRLHLSHTFSVKRKHYSLTISYSPLAFWLWTRPNKEKSDEFFYENFLHKGDTVIDCGAHLGTLAMTAASLVGPEGCVLACEMHPRTFSYLASNVQKNKCKNVLLHNVAIGDKEGVVSITDEYVSDINHVSSEGTISVPMKTIDVLASGLRKIDLLKLDVEGYELQALHGAYTTLPRIQAVYFEACERNFARYGYTLKDIILFLEKQGFSCFAFDERGSTFPINGSYSPLVKYENILATKN